MNQIVEINRSNVILKNDLMYSKIIEYSHETIIIHVDYNILHINQSGVNFLRGEKEELIGMNVLSIFQEHSKAMIKHRIVSDKSDKCPSEVFEETIFRADGTLVEVEIYCHPIQFNGRNAIQSVIRDVTKRKEAERLLNDREKLVSIGQISAGIAHEVRNPLTSVKGFLQLLKEHYEHPYLNTMEIELEKAIDTLQNLLQVSKPDLDSEPVTRIYLCTELS
ncbi:MAG: PAS domain S-box protein, partial [Melioribacteraceae bacterium]|nr:PAS domain S-box protein [Melioribacteraceae bacterium]